MRQVKIESNSKWGSMSIGNIRVNLMDEQTACVYASPAKMYDEGDFDSKFYSTGNWDLTHRQNICMKNVDRPKKRKVFILEVFAFFPGKKRKPPISIPLLIKTY